jgi:hypothetical protein
MKIMPFRFLTILAVACLTFTFTLNTFARQANPNELLIQAYTSLERADHDYKGHRADAMKQIEEAGKLLGVRIRGGGPGHERQWVSDEQLRTAQNLLEQARGSLKGKPLRHVNKAIKEISIALRIK